MQNLANTAWAFATLGQADAQLFTALAREAKQRMGNFNPQSLVAMACMPNDQLDRWIDTFAVAGLDLHPVALVELHCPLQPKLWEAYPTSQLE